MKNLDDLVAELATMTKDVSSKSYILAIEHVMRAIKNNRESLEAGMRGKPEIDIKKLEYLIKIGICRARDLRQKTQRSNRKPTMKSKLASGVLMGLSRILMYLRGKPELLENILVDKGGRWEPLKAEFIDAENVGAENET